MPFGAIDFARALAHARTHLPPAGKTGATLERMLTASLPQQLKGLQSVEHVARDG